jgi:hypothetical protein
MYLAKARRAEPEGYFNLAAPLPAAGGLSKN